MWLHFDTSELVGADTQFFLTTATKKKKKKEKKGVTIIYAHNANGVILQGRGRLRHVRCLTVNPKRCGTFSGVTFYWGILNQNKQTNKHTIFFTSLVLAKNMSLLRSGYTK